MIAREDSFAIALHDKAHTVCAAVELDTVSKADIKGQEEAFAGGSLGQSQLVLGARGTLG